jgi:O-succinylbenzoate synthase
MKIDRITLRQIHLPYQNPLQTSHFRVDASSAIIVEVSAEGVSGWGEAAVLRGPWYNEECVDTAWLLLEQFLAPAVLNSVITHPEQTRLRFAGLVGHHIARAGLEFAVWDAYGRAQGHSLSALLGGTRTTVPVGVSLGIYPTPEILYEKISHYVEAGYPRIKLKIAPGWDVKIVAEVRHRWSEIALQVDANSAYSPADIDHLRALDDFSLLLIEQPFAHDDLIDHARLQAVMRTAICLDESITSLEKARKAFQIDAARAINIKPARVDGLETSRQIHDLAVQQGIPVWCGGMMETGIGRAINVALASLPGFSLPGDISANSHYFARDIVTNPFTLQPGGLLTVPDTAGSGAEVDLDFLNHVTVRTITLT